MADDAAGLQSELPSSKLVRLDENPVPNLGRERLLEAHLAALFRFASYILPRVEIWLSEGALLKTLGERFNIPMTDRPPG